MNIRLVALLFCAALTTACGSNNSNSNTSGSTSSSSSSSSSSSASSSSSNSSSGGPAAASKSVIWKRVDTLQSDLAMALDISPTALCNELGSNELECFERVHLSSLGGNEPFKLNQYEVLDGPTAITAVSTDRVVMASCVSKVESDKTGSPTVFTEYNLNSVSQPSDVNYLASVDLQNTRLYQRLLARDPSTDELTILRALVSDANNSAISNSDVAKLSCYTIATTSEFVFL